MLTTSVTHLTASSLFWASVSKTKHDSKQCCSLPCFFTPLLLLHCLLFCSILITDNWNKLSCISCATFLFLSYCDITCDLLLNRCTATWNLFFEQTMENYGGFFQVLLYKMIAKLTGSQPQATGVIFTLAQSITQQQNGFQLCCGKLRENNLNK